MSQKINKDEFRALVFEVVKLIPRGRATSYGAIARAIGYSNYSRMIGSVLANSTELDIPAHRVVNNQGYLSGKNAFETPNKMQHLLESENILVINDKIKNWGTVFWDPTTELKIEE